MPYAAEDQGRSLLCVGFRSMDPVRLFSVVSLAAVVLSRTYSKASACSDAGAEARADFLVKAYKARRKQETAWKSAGLAFRGDEFSEEPRRKSSKQKNRKESSGGESSEGSSRNGRPKARSQRKPRPGGRRRRRQAAVVGRRNLPRARRTLGPVARRRKEGQKSFSGEQKSIVREERNCRGAGRRGQSRRVIGRACFVTQAQERREQDYTDTKEKEKNRHRS